MNNVFELIQNNKLEELKDHLDSLDCDERFKAITSDYFSMNWLSFCCSIGNSLILTYLLNINWIQTKLSNLIELCDIITDETYLMIGIF